VSGAGRDKPHFLARVRCIPATVQYRPPRWTARPVVHGVQTAMVVGPKGEEIHCDDLGRVKVQFHWDRDGGRDDNSSCWVRVSQPWGGMGQGGMFIPRIGQEVIVQFLEGDPDRPIIVGRVYNGENPVPHGLPAAKNVSTIRSASTPGGNGFNELRFDDSAGGEQIYIHAQSAMDIEVLGHKTEDVIGSVTEKFHSTQSTTVDSDVTENYLATQKTTVTGDVTEIYQANQTTEVTGNVKETYKAKLETEVTGNVKETYKAQLKTEVTGNTEQHYKANQTITVDGHLKETVETGVEETYQNGYKQTISGGARYEISDGLTNKVTGATTENFVGPVNISTTSNYALSVNGIGELSVKSAFTIMSDTSILLKAPTVNIESDDWFERKGKKGSLVGFQFDTIGLLIASAGVEVGVLGFSRKAEVFKKKESATTIINIGVSIETNITQINMAAMAMFL